MDKHLHIVTHDVPWPADFGGTIDLFYKIKALHSLGIKIQLHCFTNKRPEQEILKKYCVSVQYYPRKKGFAAFSLSVPYIVQSRSNEKLFVNLSKDNHPILLEGIHCTYLLQAGRLQDRKVFVRLHNVEHKYYRKLAAHENHFIKKTYYNIESFLLEKYERKLATKAVFWTVSKGDAAYYKDELQATQVHFVPVFLPWNKVDIVTGKGPFCLYHGNLSVNENEKAVEWLLKEVFNDLNLPLVIAGKDASAYLKELETSHPNSCIVVNPSEGEMQDLIHKAQVNILPSFNDTGVKLKVLNALFNGRHCLVNAAAVEGSGVEDLCTIAGTASQFKERLVEFFTKPFSEEDLLKRENTLKEIYDAEQNAMKLIAWIY